jgi:hypothetical protein
MVIYMACPRFLIALIATMVAIKFIDCRELYLLDAVTARRHRKDRTCELLSIELLTSTQIPLCLTNFVGRAKKVRVRPWKVSGCFQGFGLCDFQRLVSCYDKGFEFSLSGLANSTLKLSLHEALNLINCCKEGCILLIQTALQRYSKTVKLTGSHPLTTTWPLLVLLGVSSEF